MNNHIKCGLINKSKQIGSMLLILTLLLSSLNLKAQEVEESDEVAEVTIQLTFSQSDSTRICTAVLVAGEVPVKEKEIHFYVKRMYSLLPIGSAVETDSNGIAVAEYPLNLPGDLKGNYMVVARLEDDDTYGTVEKEAEVNWGVQPKEESHHWGNRSLSASRERAPTYLILVSNMIIAVIWGVLVYIVIQVFRIRKESRILKAKVKQ